MDVIHTLILQTIPPLAAAPIPTDGGGAGTWSGLLFYIGIALGLSFLCSVLEAVLLSTNHSFIEIGIEKGQRSARIMQRLKHDVERPISAILTLNTIAHTVGAAGAGAEAVGIFGSEMFGVISAVLTLLILVFSEIIPKTLGATYWKALNPFAAYMTQFLVTILFPAVWLLEKTTQIMKPSSEQPTVSRVELEVMARISTSEGALLERENRILTNLLHLRNVQAQDIMTPRTVMLSLQRDMTIKEVLQKHTTLPYSRLPIYGGNLDDIEGFVLRHDIYYRYANNDYDTPVHELRRDLRVVPETNSVAQVLEDFSRTQAHIFLVIDEYGGTAGIITMEDAIETLLGIEITDESDLVADLRKAAAQRYARQSELLEIVTMPLRNTNNQNGTGHAPADDASDVSQPADAPAEPTEPDNGSGVSTPSREPSSGD